MKVFYSKNQSVKSNKSFSPSAGKPRLLIELWNKLKLPIEVIEPKRATFEELTSAHDSQYVKEVLAGVRENGFGNTSEEVALSLPWTSGSMTSAALYAARTKETTVSLTSGFHHARYSGGGGFCTFNGLIVATRALQSVGFQQVGILDCDMHYGDGTANCIKELKLEDVSHYSMGGHLYGPEESEMFLKQLPKIIENMFRDCDVLLYQAGVDCHIDDPMGGIFTTDQMKRRDQIIFETCERLGIPICWNLAGGYQSPIEKVLKIHTNTLVECLKVSRKRKVA